MSNWLINLILIGLVGFFVFKYSRLTAPFLPTKRQDLRRVAELLKKYHIQSLVDLGSGTGSVVSFLAAEFPAGQFRGIEISPILFLLSRIRLWSAKNVELTFGSLFAHDYHTMDGVFLFWTPRTIIKHWAGLRPRIISGQYVISYAFEITFLRERLVERNQPNGRLPIYVYRMK